MKTTNPNFTQEELFRKKIVKLTSQGYRFRFLKEGEGSDRKNPLEIFIFYEMKNEDIEKLIDKYIENLETPNLYVKLYNMINNNNRIY
jgi:hypothetical protein